MNERKEFSFEIIESVGSLSDKETAVHKELNIVKWNDGKANYDLRNWKQTAEGKKPLKGITLTLEEIKTLRDILNGIDLEK